MKIRPIKTKEDYKKFTEYLDSLYGIDFTEEQTNEVLIIQQLLEHYEQNNMSKVKENFDNLKNFDHIYEMIQNVSSLEGYGLLERVCKLQEEVGELSAEALKMIGFKYSTLSEIDIKRNILLEAVDCLIMSMDILTNQNFSKKEIIDMSTSQIDKWLSNLKNKI